VRWAAWQTWRMRGSTSWRVIHWFHFESGPYIWLVNREAKLHSVTAKLPLHAMFSVAQCLLVAARDSTRRPMRFRWQHFLWTYQGAAWKWSSAYQNLSMLRMTSTFSVSHLFQRNNKELTMMYWYWYYLHAFREIDAVTVAVDVKTGKQSFRRVRIDMARFGIGVVWLILTLTSSSSSSPLTPLISSLPGSQVALAVPH
jgi:hypothetical protein